MLPHAGYVALDRLDNNRSRLVHLVTYETFVLIGTQWELDFDEDGFGFLISTDPNWIGQPIILEEKFQFNVYQDSIGAIYITCNNDADHQIMALAEYKGKHLCYELEVELGATRAVKKFNIVVYRFPRKPNAKVMWCMKSVYEQLRLSQFNGQSWRWVAGSWKRWQGLMTHEYDMEEHVLPSLAMKEGKQSDTDPGTALSHCSVSSHALLALSLRWCIGNKRQSGFTEDGHRQAARELFEALIAAIIKSHCSHSPDGFEITIDVIEGYVVRWPGVQQITRPAVLRVDIDGVVYWREFCDQVFKYPVPASSSWTEHNLCKPPNFLRNAYPTLAQVVCHAFELSSRNFLKQLLWELGNKLQAVCMEEPTEQHPFTTLKRTALSFAEVLTNAPLLDRMLVRYVESGKSKAAVHGIKYYSIATDKASVCGLGSGLQNGIIGFGGTKYAMLGVPQAVPAYDGNIDNAEDEGPKAVADAVKQSMQRQESWCKRAEDPDHGAWRPNKRYRVGAKHWCQSVDNIIRSSTPLAGLSAFIIPKDEATGLLPHWTRWCHLTLSTDQGSDALCAASFLRSEGVHLTVMADMSHAGNNDFFSTLKDLGLYQAWLIMLVPWNVEHGPFNDDMRYNQVRGAWSEATKHFSPSTMPLFLEASKYMVEEAGGESQIMNGSEYSELDAAVWDRMRNGWNPKGYKVNLHRFHDTIEKALAFAPWWSCTHVKHSYCALECGMFATKSMAKLVVQTSAPADEPGASGGSTDARRPNIPEKSLRGLCQNSLVISAFMLGDRWNYMMVQAVGLASRPLLDWHKKQNKEMRSSDDAHRWLVDQLAGGFAMHIKLILKQTAEPEVIAKVGMNLTLPNAARSRSTWPDNDELVCQDELAQLFAEFSMTLAARRIHRSSFFVVGWPARLAGLCGPEWLVQKTKQEFKADAGAFKKLKEHNAKTAAMKEVEKRSAFNDLSTQQFETAFAEADWIVTAGIKHLAKMKMSGVLSTQVCEDVFNHMKNAAAVKGKKKYRRPEKAYGAALGRKVISGIHHYDDIPLDSVQPVRSLCLPTACFEPQKQNLSMDFKKLSGPNQKPAFYSPSAQNWGQRDSDLKLTRQAAASNDWSIMSTAWLGAFVVGEHKLVIRKKGATEWYFPRMHHNDSSVLALPAVMVKYRGGATDWAVDFDKLDEPVYIVVSDLKEWEGVHYKWRSPHWQLLNFPDIFKSQPAAIRACALEDIADLLNVLARNAFFDVSCTTLKKLADHYSIDATQGATSLDLVFDLVKGVLGISDETALDICRKRLACKHAKAAWVQELVMMEESVEMLERSDEQKYYQERDAAVRAEAESVQLVEAFGEKCRAVQKKAKGSGAGGKKKNIKQESSRISVPLWLERDIALSDARACCPPSGFIWASQRFQNWQAHYPPWPRVSRAWSKWTYAGALNERLKHIWTLHAQANGMQIRDLPVDGLFPSEGQAVAAGSGSSSASRRVRGSQP